LNDNFYIDTNYKFNEFIVKAKQQKVIALDTEFLWRKTYYPILGLIQAAFSKDEYYLIDTIALKDITALGEILADRNIIKILHDAHQDLLILSRSCNYVVPVNIFDTRRAAGFAGLDHTASLAKIIYELFNVSLSKSETTTDWTRRPLTKNQIKYAIDDVTYMCEMREILLKRARNNGLENWLIDEMKIYEDKDSYRVISPEERYLKFKIINRLSNYNIKLLKYLAAWRETEAENKNIPKTFIFKDGILFKIVMKDPKNIAELGNVEGMLTEKIKKYGHEIIKILQKARVHEEKLQLKHQRIIINNNDLIKLKKFIADKAHELNMPVELIATRSDLVKFLEDKKSDNLSCNKLLKTWRREIFLPVI